MHGRVETLGESTVHWRLKQGRGDPDDRQESQTYQGHEPLFPFSRDDVYMDPPGALSVEICGFSFEGPLNYRSDRRALEMVLGGRKVGIIGAGLSGLMAGRILQDRGVKVTLFDKARRPGERANTREHGSHRFDHGAQFFTVRDPGIRRHLDSWIDAGVVAEWRGVLVRIKGDVVEPATSAARYVGVPGMINLPAALAEGLDVRVDTQVDRLRFKGPGWTLWDVDEWDLGSFDSVLVALPPAQAAELLTHAPKVHALIQDVEIEPCWAGMYVFERPLALGFDGAFLADEALSWIARNSSKPGRPEAEAWVIHANPEWTHENLRMDQDQAAMELLRKFQALFGSGFDPVFQRGHRWAFASGSYPTPRGAIFDTDLGIGACGDWCMGGRIEGALLSAAAAADHIMVAQAAFQTPS